MTHQLLKNYKSPTYIHLWDPIVVVCATTLIPQTTDFLLGHQQQAFMANYQALMAFRGVGTWVWNNQTLSASSEDLW